MVGIVSRVCGVWVRPVSVSGSGFPSSFRGIRNRAGSGTGEVMGLLSPIRAVSARRGGRTPGLERKTQDLCLRLRRRKAA